ncbi:polyphosphate kinase 2 [Parablastomonas sp. CN1-191]|uniref:polyphosphate kinase 2 n=1 Tax=Parablastomonas sp. CN1-191 TaxID=3400908 RepID=UPI003BF83517
MSHHLKRKAYDKLYEPIEKQLVGAARMVAATGARVVVVFEGRDTGGKGGAIQDLSGPINPRQCRVVALPKPNECEAAQWYFQRYVAHLPAAGEIVLFDRSWYNRAGVEKVMGFATPAEVEDFLAQAPAFEKLLVDDGILLFKYWLCTDQAQQEKRLRERAEDPLKQWKLSPVDFAARKHYADYTAAREAMLRATHTAWAPWTLVDFNDQKLGRLTLLQDFLQRLPPFEAPAADIKFPKLRSQPQRETFQVLEPIAPFKE